MTRLERVIEQVKRARTTNPRAWIFDDDGQISNEVICGEVLDILNALKDFEINVSDEWIDDFTENPRTKGDNTYNWSANISNDLNMDWLVTSNGEVIYLIAVHLGGDVRCNYSDYFAVKFEYGGQLFELECMTQSVEINDRYVADINPLCEGYNVYDYKYNEDVGEFYHFEKSDLLIEIAEKYEKDGE